MKRNLTRKQFQKLTRQQKLNYMYDETSSEFDKRTCNAKILNKIAKKLRK